MVTMSLSSEFQLHCRLIMQTSINLCIEVILFKERENAIWGSVWSETTTAIDSKSSFSVWIQEREVHWDLWKFILNEIFFVFCGNAKLFHERKVNLWWFCVLEKQAFWGSCCHHLRFLALLSLLSYLYWAYFQGSLAFLDHWHLFVAFNLCFWMILFCRWKKILGAMFRQGWENSMKEL